MLVDPTPLTERTTESLRQELAEREMAFEHGHPGARGLLNRSRIAMIRTELDRRRREAEPSELVIPVDLTVVQRGLWCHACALPSVVRVAVTLVADPTVRLTQVNVCTDCGEHGDGA